MKRIIVTVDELLAELNEGGHYPAKPETRIKLNEVITHLASIVQARKLSAPKKVKRTRATAPQVTLEAWEARRGYPLALVDIESWVAQNQFCKITIAQLIEEFRDEMRSKALKYANFALTFQTYLRKGYLSKKPEQVLAKNSPHTAAGFKDKQFRHGVQL